ncbi:uncharacterized protein LOC125225798 isoform X1 [Leguminivora glycinivorella]|uniref:uncharacterized protein LOC125225798 isoform X1 n=1 Tax=Leguminivora glycinivorella TaxID=1035111 RepID=UPI00200D1D23|nr:uncharacterized protein LOC125225798 isoform X1 [Leguminivora glycinivorella]
MKPYLRANKTLMVQQLRSASRLGRLRLLAGEFAADVCAMWRYGAPFPTFLKIVGTLVMCLLFMMPILYPIFVFMITYFTFEGLFLSWWLVQPWRFTIHQIGHRVLGLVFRVQRAREVYKVREVLTRAILLAHSLATSIDYLCVMQGLLDEA